MSEPDIITQEVERVRAALPPLGVRAKLDAVAFNAGLDPATFTRRLGVLAAGGEARLKDGWVERAVPVARVEIEAAAPSRYSPPAWTPTPEPGAREER